VLDYAPIAELSGRSAAIAPEAMNCSAPDTGNMELLAMFASDEQRSKWLEPLLRAEIRSCFSMTEPAVASSDATNIATTITADGDAYVVNGLKWWSTGALRPECKVAIVMGVSDPDAGRYQRHSMILVPLDTPGVTIERSTTVFGYDDGPHGGHGVIHYDDVRVPRENLLGPQGGGFLMAQARLGPGRIHHCMRSLGMAERALELMCARAAARSTFGQPIAAHGMVQEWIAESRLAIEQARLLVLKTAWLIDTVGARQARTEIAAIKVAAPRAASYVLDRAIQVHGAAGVSGDTSLAEAWAQLRTLHLADGPDEVHLRSLARDELKRHASV
jgi:acyl-CoA dehydrogenase